MSVPILEFMVYFSIDDVATLLLVSEGVKSAGYLSVDPRVIEGFNFQRQESSGRIITNYSLPNLQMLSLNYTTQTNPQIHHLHLL